MMKYSILLLTVILTGCSSVPVKDRSLSFSCSHYWLKQMGDDDIDKHREILIMGQRFNEIKDGIACRVKFTI